jgi:hypothetical protein
LVEIARALANLAAAGFVAGKAACVAARVPGALCDVLRAADVLQGDAELVECAAAAMA